MGSLFTWVWQHWYVLLPLLLGFLAIWKLLPHARQPQSAAMMGLGAAAIILGGIVLPRATGVHVSWMFDLFFYLFAGAAIASAGAMITQRNPVYAALYFALVILNVCGLFLLQSGPFLAAATVIVYAGAIIVTFLFVIMFAQQSGLAQYDRRCREPLLASLAGFLLMGALLYAINASYQVSPRLTGLVKGLEETVNSAAKTTKLEVKDLMGILRVNDAPIDLLLAEELNRLPGWPEKAAARAKLHQLETQVIAAAANQDTAVLLNLVKEYYSLAASLQHAQQRYTGMLGIPAGMQTQVSPLSRRTEEPGHVAQLGRTLFGDYLLAVELAAVLLLIATVGAIVIVQRPKEAAA